MERLEELQKEDFDEVWKIMEESFPVDERRDRDGQQKILEEAAYHLYGCRTEGRIAAFFAVWEFERFSFIEHFAVETGSRNGGIGARLLRQLLEAEDAGSTSLSGSFLAGKPVVLEVEPPNGEIQRRRIGFYERNGFVLNRYPYVQPAMSKEGKEIPLLIMSCPAPLLEEEFEEIRDTLYREVYRK